MTLQPPDQQSIRDAITREESRLLRLEEELTEAQARLLSLKATQNDSTEISLSGNSVLSACPSPKLRPAGKRLICRL